MTRKVSVALEADVAPYVYPVGRAGAATEALDDKIKALDRDLGKLPADSLKAAAALKLLGDESAKAGTDLNSIGDKSTGLVVLDARIREARAEVKKLGEEFVRTGSVDVFQKLGSADSRLRALTEVRKSLAGSLKEGVKDAGIGNDLIASVKSATQGSSGIIGTLTSAFGGMGPELQIVIGAVLVQAIAGSAAFVGAALNGVLLTGLGLGGLALGIVGQISNPMVRDAFARLGHDIKSQFTDITSSFARPLAYSASIFEGAWHAIMPKLKADFEWLSKFIVPLASGFAGLFSNMMPGLDKGFSAAGPLLQQFANELPGLGKSLSNFFKLLADGSKGAGEGLHALFVICETLIVGIGGLIDGLSHLWQGFVSASEAVSGFAAKMLGWYPVLGNFLKTVHGWWSDIASGGNNVADVFGKTLPTAMDAMGTVGGNAFVGLDQKMRDALSTVERLNKAFDELFGKTMNVDQAAIAYQAAIDNLTKSFTANGRSLDINTDKGRANQQAILAVISSIESQRQAAIAAGDGSAAAADRANAAYVRQLEALRAQLVALHANTSAIDDLINKYKNIPPIDIHVRVHVAQIGSVSAQGVVSGGVPLRGAYAAGGDVRETGPQLFGERGPEIRWASRNDYVSNATQTRQMMATGGVGGVEVTHRLIVQTDTGQEILNKILGSPGLAVGLQKLRRTGQLQSLA